VVVVSLDHLWGDAGEELFASLLSAVFAQTPVWRTVPNRSEDLFDTGRFLLRMRSSERGTKVYKGHEQPRKEETMGIENERASSTVADLLGHMPKPASSNKPQIYRGKGGRGSGMG